MEEIMKKMNMIDGEINKFRFREVKGGRKNEK